MRMQCSEIVKPFDDFDDCIASCRIDGFQSTGTC